MHLRREWELFDLNKKVLLHIPVKSFFLKVSGPMNSSIVPCGAGESVTIDRLRSYLPNGREEGVKVRQK